MDYGPWKMGLWKVGLQGPSWAFKAHRGHFFRMDDESYLGGRIMDLGKGAFGMWAFIAHGGLSKPTVGFPEYGDHFSEKKKRLRQRRGPFRASRNMGVIFLKKKKKRLRQRSWPSRACRKMGAIFL